MRRLRPLLVILLAFVLFNPATVSAQKCASSVRRAESLAKNPSLIQQRDAIEAFTESWIEAQWQQDYESQVVESLPVVVHVVYRTAIENISDAQIASQLEVLNADFRKLNRNLSQTPAAFLGIAANVEIEFCLASTDPDGNPTNGITRTPTNVNNLGETDSYYRSAEGGKDAWDVNRYINIWVCDIGDDGTLGFATIPGSADPPESDGLVIGHQYFGTVGTALTSAPNHLGRTATHEMGHYFNLEHLWGEDQGGCNEDDFVSDTPNQFEDSFDCPTFPTYDDCTSSGNGINFQNYMDYTDDECMTMFTQGQKNRMLAALNGPRAQLLTNSCSAVVNVNNNRQDLSLTAFPNPASNFLTIQCDDDFKLDANRIWLSDATGRDVLEIAPQKLVSVDVSGLSAGVYFLRSSGYNYAKRILISK